MKDAIKAKWDAAKKAADDRYNQAVKDAEYTLRSEKDRALEVYKAEREEERTKKKTLETV